MTAAHPFWVTAGEALKDRPAPDNIPQAELNLDGSGRWVHAVHLRVGDVLQTRTDGTVRISALSREDREQRVYNLWVDEIHTYAVSTEEVVVHNNDFAEELVRLTINGTLARKIYLDARAAFEATNGVRAQFLSANHLPAGTFVHHAVELQVLQKFPGLFSPAELNSLSMLRGIPADINGPVHYGAIRVEWNRRPK